MDFTAFLAGASLTAGRIVVLDLNGNIKILAPGQAIAPGELVIETLEETDVPQFRIATDAGETNITDDIQQIFAALEEGQDPTQLGDDFATAAGETGGSSLVAGGTISRTGAESLASTDFSTQGLQALGLNEAQSLSLFDLLNDANTTLQDIDSIAPSAPTVTLDTDSGSKADDFLTNDGSYTVKDIEDGATVEYFVDGEWTTTEPVAVEGENTIIIRQTDEAGNSSESSTLTFTLDTTAPDAPQISLDTDSGSLADDFLTNKGDFTVAGTEEGATVEYFVNGEWTTTAPTPVEGDNTIIVRQTDAAGNTSGSSTLTFTLDTTAPDAPQISLDTDSGSLADDFLTNKGDFTVAGTEEGATVLDTDSGSLADDFLTNKGDFTVAGTEEGATVEYFVNGEWTTTAPTPLEGDNTIIVRQTDAAGNTSGSSTLTFTLDSTAPDAPQISLDTDSGSLADDFLTNKGDFTVAGTEEGATVEYFVNGDWTTTAPTPVEGENTIIVRQTDAAGNTSGSSTLTFTLDTTAQAGTVSVDPITSDDVITETEKNQTITVTGSATGGDIKTGDVVTAIINGNEYKGSVSEDGTWELSVSGSDLAVDTAFEVTVNSTDAAGNEVTSTGESVHRLNDVPVAKYGTAETEENTVLTGNVPAAEDVDGTVESYQLVDDVAQGSLNFNANGSYTFIPGSDFDDLPAGDRREVTFTYSATDNNGGVSEPKTITITVTGTNDAPTATAATGSVTEDASITGSISAEDVDLPAGASLTFSTTSTAAGLTLNADGSYSFDASSYDSLKAGEEQVITIPVVVTDDQGATAETTLTITVTGTNDAPVVDGTFTGAVTEGNIGDAAVTAT
ncbi:Ig-like domain-containing protein, partial [Vibrio vulnificus]|uniref:Ig-like domain-containing protein n=1 Tax=Vibrio vulnificus TaxID=672 RepID=UPI00111525DB